MSPSPVRGRRLPDSQWPNLLAHGNVYQDGDYWFVTNSPQERRNEGFDGTWAVYFGAAALISRHKVIEHDDGTISVPPPGPGEPANSILIMGNKDSWHGFIREGVWEPTG